MAFFATSEHLPLASAAWKDKGPKDPDPPTITPPKPPPPKRKRYKIWHQCGEERWLGTNPYTGEIMWLCDQFFRLVRRNLNDRMGAQVRGKLQSRQVPDRLTQDRVDSKKGSYPRAANNTVINENVKGV